MLGLSPRAALVAPIAVAAATALVPVRAATLLYSDANWQVTTAAPAAGWNSSAGFDASAWQAATVLYNVADYLGPSYAAQGIWSSGGQFSTTETSIWARREFDLAALPVSASLEMGIDDDGDVWVNGQIVAGSHDGAAGNFGVADVLPYLRLGSNVIGFSATDNYPVYGYNHSAWLQIDGQAGAPSGVPEPQTLMLMLGAIGALALARRRPMQAA